MGCENEWFRLGGERERDIDRERERVRDREIERVLEKENTQ